MPVRAEIRKLWEDNLSTNMEVGNGLVTQSDQPVLEKVDSSPEVRPEIRKLWDDSLNEEPTDIRLWSDAQNEMNQQITGEGIGAEIGGTLVKPPEQQVGGESIMGKIFDVLSRGEYASANVAKDYIMGKPFNMKSAIEGIKGDKKGTYDELSEAVFSEWSPWKRKAMGFALAIFADPTTYTPAGALTVPFKAAKHIPGVTKGIEAIKNSPLGKAFVPGAGLPKDYYEAKYYAKKGLEAEEQKIFRQAEELRSGLSKDDMEKLSFYRQHPDKIHELSPLLKAKLEKVGDMFEGFVTKAEADGIITPEIAAKWRGQGTPYLPGYYPARGIKLAKGDMPPSMFEKVKKPTFMKKKTFKTLEDAKQLSGNFEQIANADTVEQARGLMKTFGLEGAFGKISNLKVDDIRGYAKQLSETYKPEENVVKLVAYRGIEQVRYTARTKFIDDTLEEFGTKLQRGTKIVPEGYGIYLPKGSIRMYATEVVDPSFVKDFKGLADQLRDLRVNTEKISSVKTTTETTVSGVGKLADGGPLAKMEGVVRDSLMSRGMTIGEANVYIGKLKANGSGAVDDIIKEVNEKSETVRTILNSSALEGDLIDISKLTDAQKKTMIGITTRVPSYALPKEIADDLNYATKIMSGDPSTAKMFQLFDKTQNIWKGLATAVRLPFHIRNMYSNWWQAALSGVQNPNRFVQAAQIQKSFLTKTKGTMELGEKVYSYKELRELSNKLGIRGKGWLGADIDVNMFDEVESMVKYGKLRKLNPMTVGRNFGTMIEDNSRMAVFLDRLAKGQDPKDASRAVRKYLFDYKELTDFERKVMKRAVPFYTWTRKNAPLQIQSLVEQPRKYQAYAKAARAFEEDETLEERMAKPEYFDKMMYVKSPFKSKLGKPLYMSIDLPPLEFNRSFDINQWLSSTTPFKVIPEIIFNFKTFPEPGKLGKPLELARAPFWVGWLPKPIFNQMSNRGLVDKMLNENTGEYELGINKKLLHGIHTALPFLNEQSRIHAEPISLEDENPDLKRKSYMSGIGFKTLDIPRELERKESEVGIRESYLDSFVGQRGRLPTMNELKELK